MKMNKKLLMFVTISFMCLVFSVMVAPSFAQTPWSTEIVDSNIGGSGSSLALDSANNPHISYLTYDNSLKYAWRDGGGWHTEVVATNVWSASLALDSAGIPHISYTESGAEIWIPVLKYASRVGAVWQTETVTTGGSNPSLAFDKTGSPHMSYNRGSHGLYIISRGVTGWGAEGLIVQTIGPPISSSSLALDSAGQPHVSYVIGGSGGGLLFDAHAMNDLIPIDSADISFTSSSTSLAFGPTNTPHTSYTSGNDVKYTFRGTSGVWQIETVDTVDYQHLNYNFLRSSLTVDNAGNPHISYGTINAGTPTDLKYAWRDSSGWHSQTVQTNGWDPSLALDSAGTPHISYISWPSENPSHTDLVYASAQESPFVVPETAVFTTLIGTLAAGGVFLAYKKRSSLHS